jgi:hypothetical protein
MGERQARKISQGREGIDQLSFPAAYVRDHISIPALRNGRRYG